MTEGPTKYLIAAVLLLATMPAVGGSETHYFRTVTLEDFLLGTLDGLAVDPAGALSLADRVDRIADLGEPFLFSLADHPRGWVVGTGNGGKVILVRRDGSVETLFAAPEPEIFAVWADDDGTVFAGSSPEGKVYRLADGVAEEYFDPEESYIWSLARGLDGGLLVATGTNGRLYRVRAPDKGEIVYDGEDTHLRAMEVLADGEVLVGTAGEGLILRIAGDGTVRTLYDGAEPEVVALAEGPAGTYYAALLASEASLVDLQARQRGEGRQQGEPGPDQPEGGGEQADAIAFAGSRPTGYRGPRSVIVRIIPPGLVEQVWAFEDETVYALRWHRDRLWVGTGLDGKLYSLRAGEMVLEKDVDERQIVSLAAGLPGPVFATTNAAAVFSTSEEEEARGSYTSAALDAGNVARFGSLRWRGELPQGSRVTLTARSGMSAEPDRTWSEWSSDAQGWEVTLSTVPPGRYVQWRAELGSGKGGSPRISEVTLSYLQENLAPRIASFSALAPGEIFVPANFNPGTQVFEPTSPARGGIFTTLEAAGAQGEQRRKSLWKKGYQTLTWEAEDPNEDDLVFDLEFRPEAGDRPWLPLAADLEEDYHSFDAAALADGIYRFRLTARDRDQRDRALASSETSAPVLIDNSVPVLGATRASEKGLEVELSDALSPLRRVRFSVDAERWEELPAVDGMLDERRESFVLPLPEAASLLLLQAMDAGFNTVTFDLSGELR
jgi:hypothetical protein